MYRNNGIYIYIYTRKPGRSPTRQYGVLRPFLTCAASLDFFGVSSYITGLDMCKICTEAVHSIAL